LHGLFLKLLHKHLKITEKLSVRNLTFLEYSSEKLVRFLEAVFLMLACHLCPEHSVDEGTERKGRRGRMRRTAGKSRSVKQICIKPVVSNWYSLENHFSASKQTASCLWKGA